MGVPSRQSIRNIRHRTRRHCGLILLTVDDSMARPTLPRSSKFQMMLVILRLPAAHCRGYLELLWDSVYESGEAYIGPAELVERIATWPGEPGCLVKALLECGKAAPSGCGFIEPHPTLPGFQIHDLWDHAPDYVRKRFSRREGTPPIGGPRDRTGYVYVMTGGDRGFKIGLSRDPSRRKKEISQSEGVPVEVLFTRRTHDMFSLEREFHRRFIDRRLRGEWFALDESDLEILEGILGDEDGRGDQA